MRTAPDGKDHYLRFSSSLITAHADMFVLSSLPPLPGSTMRPLPSPSHSNLAFCSSRVAPAFARLIHLAPLMPQSFGPFLQSLRRYQSTG
uniref:Uncharacterized protein n=1 Tax=Knipowitschia caucasica TaxID=637954 RepID=A0AAV2K338_KNICA